MSSSPTLILASQSLQRQELFSALGYPFTAVPADIDELAIDHPNDKLRVEMVAVAKAKKISAEFPVAVVVAADTFVVLAGNRLEKPATVVEAKEMLHKLSGQSFTVYTGWSVINGKTEEHYSGAVLIEAAFRPLSAIEVDHYTQTQPVTTWAGGFSIKNEAGISLISRLNGSLTGLLGIPIEVIQPILASIFNSKTGL